MNGAPVRVESKARVKPLRHFRRAWPAEPVDRVGIRFGGQPQPAGQVVASSVAGDWPVGSTGAIMPPAAWLVVRSAGEETGDFAHIFVNGVDVAHNERGYNLVAIDAGGTVLGREVFDTSGDDTASDGLVRWLAQWPDGTLIVGAVADEASLKLTGRGGWGLADASGPPPISAAGCVGAMRLLALLVLRPVRRSRQASCCSRLLLRSAPPLTGQRCTAAYVP